MTKKSDRELMQDLKDHLDNLEDDLRAASSASDPTRFLKRISGTLRILVCRVSREEPLLIELIEKFKAPIMLHFDLPPLLDKRTGKPRPSTQTLRDYMNHEGMQVPNLGPITHEELVRLWAHKMGGAHQSRSLPKKLVAALEGGILSKQITGFDATQRTLLLIGKHTLIAGRKFLRLMES